MNQQNSHEEDLDRRLTAYYGPPLREQPLPSSEWHKLRQNLGPQKMPRRKLWHGLRRPARNRRAIPAYIQDAFVRVTHEARRSERLSTLRCTFKMRVGGPTVRIAPLWRPLIQLTLPLDAEIHMGQTELDVLLGIGLARLLLTSSRLYRLTLLISTCLILLSCIALVYSWTQHIVLMGILIVIGILTCIIGVLSRQKRAMAFTADALVVNWLGRGRVCQGLHSLANHSRTPRHRRWSEPSLTERIERVCATRVESRDNSLTLAR